MTNLITQAIAYNVANKVEVRRSGTAYDLYYGGTKYGATQSVVNSAIDLGMCAGVFSADPANLIASYEILPNQ